MSFIFIQKLLFQVVSMKSKKNESITLLQLV